VFEPNELVEKLVRWCPGPVRYHGVLVPNARLRKAVEAGRPAYRGSEQNGIKSRDYGKSSRSYAVVTE